MMNDRKQWVCLVAGVLSCAVAGAACYGSRSFQTCSDDPGRADDVRRYGGATQPRVAPAPAGEAPNRPVPPPGDARLRQGAAAGAGAGTSQNYGDTTYRQGIDPRGRFYNKTCVATGCF